MVFVCSGNICRSPIAEKVLAQELTAPGWPTRCGCPAPAPAAGTSARPPTTGPPRCCGREGYPDTHEARQVDAEDLAADLIVALDRSHQRMLRVDGPEPDRVRLLRSFDPAAPPDAEVPDPYYGGAAGFADVLAMIRAAMPGLLDWVRAQPMNGVPAAAGGRDEPRPGGVGDRRSRCGGARRSAAGRSRVELADGRTVLVKDGRVPAAVAAEAAGLRWLRVPRRAAGARGAGRAAGAAGHRVRPGRGAGPGRRGRARPAAGHAARGRGAGVRRRPARRPGAGLDRAGADAQRAEPGRWAGLVRRRPAAALPAPGPRRRRPDRGRGARGRAGLRRGCRAGRAAGAAGPAARGPVVGQRRCGPPTGPG